MKKEEVDGSTAYRGLYTEDGLTWNIIVRSGGSVSLYATRPGESVHHVIYDTLDGAPPNATARAVMARLSEMAEGVNALLTAAQIQPAAGEVVSARSAIGGGAPPSRI
jgi:hypothetical protein